MDYLHTRGLPELDIAIMKARDLMTRKVVSASPETPIRDIAALLSANRISAVPVVDETGTVVGMVSEGDLIGRRQTEREKQREWWLVMLAEGETLSDEFLASLLTPDRTAREVMSSPVIQVTEEAEASEIAALLARHRIKRVPVVRDSKIVGIISRADLLRALATIGNGGPHRTCRFHSRASRTA